MCGIAGFVDFTRSTGRAALAATATRMASTLSHRGPDDAGVWVDEQAGVALAHRRLAILDLTPEGRQPMVSADGRWVVSFNGEIYNHAALREELEAAGHVFRGRSDTEVLLAAVQRWGVEPALARFNGMFAVALWDRADRVLHLFRDRLGEKPLYHGRFGSCFLFGSELTPLRVHPAFEGRISRGALALYMRHNHVPAPHAIYEGVRKLPPASILSVSARSPEPEERRYWSLQGAWNAGLRERFRGDDREAVDHLDALLRDAVALRKHADVPLGAFLSGGVDSSTVVALMQAGASRRVRTFTIGFTEPAYDEAPAARAIAQHLGTDHTELYVTPEHARAVIPALPRIYDEPFADSSQIPTFLVSRLARTGVTVSLSGDGGDETFGGYGRYELTRRLWRGVGWLPVSARAALAAALEPLAVPALPRAYVRRLRRLAAVLPAPGVADLYRDIVFSHWQVPGGAVVAGAAPPTPLALALRDGGRGGALLDRMTLWDLIAYLPDDILVKVDRAAMAVSLESRMPLLDHRLTEFAFTLPSRMKQRGGKAKWILRQVLHRYLPPRLVERPKRGFHMPIDDWLRGPLAAWARDLLAPAVLARQGWLDPRVIGRQLAEHLAGTHAWGHDLWVALMFQAWLAEQASAPAREAPRTAPQAEPSASAAAAR